MIERKRKVTDGQMLDFIAEFIVENGFSPTMREIGAGVGLVSPSAVKWRLDMLVEQGLVTYTPGAPRTVRPVGLRKATLDDYSRWV